MEVFAKNQLYMKLWTQEEYDKYKQFCNLLLAELHPPDLLVYLNASLPTLRERIKKRGREYEKGLLNIDDPYLGNLQKLYDDWFSRYTFSPKLLVRTDSLNFVENPEDVNRLILAVKRSLDAKGMTLKKYM
jgi:deoxyadenosine/deoxycytidine kinase